MEKLKEGKKMDEKVENVYDSSAIQVLEGLGQLEKDQVCILEQQM